jgi:hypothetical protein
MNDFVAAACPSLEGGGATLKDAAVALVFGAGHPERSEGSQLSLTESRSQDRDFLFPDTDY